MMVMRVVKWKEIVAENVIEDGKLKRNLSCLVVGD
jgi:hypothetical protein